MPSVTVALSSLVAFLGEGKDFLGGRKGASTLLEIALAQSAFVDGRLRPFERLACGQVVGQVLHEVGELPLELDERLEVAGPRRTMFVSVEQTGRAVVGVGDGADGLLAVLGDGGVRLSTLLVGVAEFGKRVTHRSRRGRTPVRRRFPSRR